MQHNDSLPRQCAEKDPSNSLASVQPKLEEPVSQGTRVRHAQVRTIGFHTLGVPQKASDQANRQTTNLLLDIRVVESYGPIQEMTTISNMRYRAHIEPSVLELSERCEVTHSITQRTLDQAGLDSD